ncbi:MAG: bifunctional folylpolyglutamate synthase/dihydrofolate synthase [Phycisphaerae bacterium]|nr:bifunctional folylpolyglutamate synthase/dihydrofolate synthase [Phycisphaerae bacterium]
MKIGATAPAKPSIAAEAKPIVQPSTKPTSKPVKVAAAEPAKAPEVKSAAAKSPEKAAPKAAASKSVAGAAAKASKPPIDAAKTITSLKPGAVAGIATKASDISNYSTAVRWLLERTDIERMRVVKYSEETFKLDRMRALLTKLGNPQNQFRSVHVAGTNGKGSTTAMLAAMLQECGYAVGLYTSPHLVDLRERIQINGVMIEKSDFTDLLKEVADAAAKLDSEPTFFEIVTAIGFLYFAERAVDIAIIEVGLGGRLDSTNVIRPEATIITSIDYDHTKLLGSTLTDIAREKAGIFKKDVPAFIFESEPAVEKTMVEIATSVGATLKIVNKDIEFSSRFCSTDDLGPHTRVCLYSKTSRLEHLPVPLPGEHQASNCGLALAVIDHLKTVGFDCPEEKITAGLAKTRIPGRMQLVWDRPRVLVDGAHNPAAMSALMRCVGAHVPYDSMICVFGCCADKDVPTLLDRVNLGADKVIFTRAQSNARAADPDELQRLFMERSGKMSQVARTLPEALELATRAVSREDLVCVTGSFYLVGETLKHLAHFDREKGGKVPSLVHR